ncbi:MAG: hypothetical protein JNM67_05010 [Bacteroidetes bacterium]|nr:hypothetical protein [Bacteroidota bacterium]
MDILEFISQVEQIIQQQTRRLFPADWDEDTLTRNILIEFRLNFASTTINDHRQQYNLSINPFKLRGRNTETKYGDIAILVKIIFPDGDILEGVGFLEAKKRYRNTNRFDAFSVRQLNRIYRQSPHTRLLLYDYSPITEFAPVYYDYDNYYHRHFPLLALPTTYSVATQLNEALALNRRDIGLYKVGLPLSYQLAFRYFYGFDLDFREDVINAIKGYAKDTLGLPNYTVFVTISPIDKPTNEGEPEINSNTYERLK